MPISYSRRWNYLTNEPIGPLSVAAAHKLNDAGKPYAVVLAEGSRPPVVLEVTWANDYLGVNFFDDSGRHSTQYGFVRTTPGQLFLTTFKHWAYDRPDAQGPYDAARTDSIYFEPDGTVHHETHDAATGESTSRDLQGVDLELNWEPAPEFGDWASVARFEREPPAKA